jgi:hypothetical protein
MDTKTQLFFRNDDVRGTLDKSLVEITNLFIQHKICITHAVEPANVTIEVSDWLMEMKKKNPGLIEIMQHGFDHSVKNKEKMGEFGGQRTYQEQYEDINRGYELMNQWFDEQWFHAFNFPFGPYNPEAMQALADNHFLVVNGSCGNDWKRNLFYTAAHMLRKEYFLGYRVPWNLRYRPISGIFEIDMNTGFIDKYYNEETSCKFFTLKEMQEDTLRFKRRKTIGVLLHHRYHNTSERIKLIEDYLIWIKSQKWVEFSNLERIYSKYAK